MKLVSTLSLSCLCAAAYTSNVFAAEAAIEAGDESGGSAAAAGASDASDEDAEMADSDSSAEASESEGEREAKNAIYVDLLGPGLFYSINYDRMLTEDLSARIGFSYLSFGASAGDSTASASAEFSYWAVPITVSYLGIGSDSNMLEVGGGPVIMNVKGSGVVETDETASGAEASATLFAMTGMVGYRHQPADGGFGFRIGASPVMVFDAGLLPWGYLSLGAAF
jgi:hypothetical protein